MSHSKKHGQHKGSRRPRSGRKRRRRRLPPGAAPGAFHIDPDAPRPVVQLIGYGPDATEEISITTPAQIHEHLGKWPVTWVNVDGLGDGDVLQSIAELFNLHALTLADIVNVHQRAKVEHYADHVFIVTHMLLPDEGAETEQVSVVLGKNYVLSFQERPGDCFDPVRERIRRHKGRVRAVGADYLAYLLLDAVLDNYFPVLDQYSDTIELLEDDVTRAPAQRTVARIHSVKRDLLTIRRAVWPQREAISSLLRDDSDLITTDTRLYLRDSYDHAVQLIDTVETYRELAHGLMDVYLSSVSNRMNEVMKVLTIIATIFIPLTFIAGIYGMNFDSGVSPWNMPELKWYWGYPACLAVMAFVAGGMMVYFRRKGWLGGGESAGTSVKSTPPNA